MSSTNFSFSSPSVKEDQSQPEKKQKSESSDGDYSDGERGLTYEEFKQYSDAVNASDGFDVPCFPEVSCCCLIQPYKLNDYHREKLKPLCVAALKDYNEKKNTNFEFLKLEKANTQCARGILYYLTFVGRIPKDNTTQIFEARVLYAGDDDTEVCSCREKTAAPFTTDV